MLSLSGPPGGLGRGRGLDPLPEGGGLAPLQEHLPGLVRHRARGRPVQRRHHGPAGLRHPALRVRGRAVQGGGRAGVGVGGGRFADEAKRREREREGREVSEGAGVVVRWAEEGWFSAACLHTSVPKLIPLPLLFILVPRRT